MTLTQRLLTFARRQELKIESADIPTLLTSIKSPIERSVGPMNEVAIEAAPDGKPAAIDRNQLELAFAQPLGQCARRDADNAASPSRRRNGAPPGRSSPTAIMSMSASPTPASAWMRRRLPRATEAFFSTKAPDKGTGLGLAMVRGFLEQLEEI